MGNKRYSNRKHGSNSEPQYDKVPNCGYVEYNQDDNSIYYGYGGSTVNNVANYKSNYSKPYHREQTVCMRENADQSFLQHYQTKNTTTVTPKETQKCQRLPGKDVYAITQRITVKREMQFKVKKNVNDAQKFFSKMSLN